MAHKENKVEMLLSVQVVYRQGLVKTFIAHQDILMSDFMKAVRAEGKVKTVRFMPDVEKPVADLLIHSGNAVKVEVPNG
jgi:hypothetical protein